jgi:4-diphosphocytidyl-2-C-methyl-D-erythritol kinase
LEVLGKRDDGFHEIRSILAMVELTDRIAVRKSSGASGSVSICPPGTALTISSNLVVEAIAAFNAATGNRIVPDIELEKRIPIAAGLGGASSDCAATLLALNELTGNPIDRERLAEIAASLGSDVPFFLGSPAASVSGRGTEIRTVRAPAGAVLIVSPNIKIPNKTRTLYAALRPEDYASGDSVARQAAHLDSFGSIDRDSLGNVFDVALARISDSAQSFADELTSCGVNQHWLSGAGPARYALFDDWDECERMAISVRERLQGKAQAIATRFATHGLRVRA